MVVISNRMMTLKLTAHDKVSEPVRILFAQGTQRARREYAQQLKLVYRSLLVRYEFVLGSFEIRFQFGMSNLNDHIRRISSTYTTVCQRMSNISIR